MYITWTNQCSLNSEALKLSIDLADLSVLLKGGENMPNWSEGTMDLVLPTEYVEQFLSYFKYNENGRFFIAHCLSPKKVETIQKDLRF